jgi:CxxC-x17-CxxC domain-containing protein
MHQGNWKCSSCGGAITELPFQPRSESGLTCRACYAKGKEADKGNQPVAEMPTASEPMPSDGIPDFDEYGSASEPMPADDAFAGMETLGSVAPGEKAKITGNWKCSMCGGTISSLPFTPRDTSGLKCLDCFKRSKE